MRFNRTIYKLVRLINTIYTKIIHINKLATFRSTKNANNIQNPKMPLPQYYEMNDFS